MLNTDEKPVYILKAQGKKLIFVNISALITGILLLYYWLGDKFSGNILTLIIMIGIIFIWLIVDYAYWYFKGVREIRVYDKHFELISGKGLNTRKITGAMITDIYFQNIMSRRTFQIFLGNKVREIPGIFTFFPGPKIRLVSDMFEDSAFDEACDLIEKMYKGKGEKI